MKPQVIEQQCINAVHIEPPMDFSDLSIIIDRNGERINITVTAKHYTLHTTSEFLNKSKHIFSAHLSEIINVRKYIKLYVLYSSCQAAEYEITTASDNQYKETVLKQHVILFLSDDFWITEFKIQNFKTQFDREILKIESEIRKQTNDSDTVYPINSEISIIVHDLDDELE